MAGCLFDQKVIVPSKSKIVDCAVTQIVKIEGEANYVVMGEVVGIHLRDDCIKKGRFDVTTFQPLARLGYRDYAVIEDLFELKRPDD